MALERTTETYENFNTRYRKPAYNPLDRSELDAFEKRMEKYRIKKHLTFPIDREVETYDIDRYIFDVGATNERGEIIIHDLKLGVWDGNRLVSATDCDPIPYEMAMAKVDQLLRYLGWKKKSEHNRTAQYNEMSKQLSNSLRV